MSHFPKNRRFIYLTAALAAILIFPASCFVLPAEEPPLPPPVLSTVESANYRMVAVAKGDVLVYRDLTAAYVPAREEALSFSLNDVYISSVYVEVGDFVEEGDVLAELEREHIIVELDRIAREEAWARLDLKQLEEQHEVDLTKAGVTGVEIDDTYYTGRKEELLTQLELVAIRTDYLKFENERRILTSPMSGIVTQVITFREGDKSSADQRIVTIADQTKSVFSVRGPDTKYLDTGDTCFLTINKEDFPAEVMDPDEVGISRAATDEIYIMITGGEQPAALTSRSYATIHLVLEQADDVLYVPYAAVKKANARIFVYMLQDGLRTIRDIEIGLEGNSVTEVTAGLEFGDMVIIE